MYDKLTHLRKIKVPMESEEYFINSIGCLRHIRREGSLEISSVIPPEDIGDYLDPNVHELIGYIIIENSKYVLYKDKIN